MTAWPKLSESLPSVGTPAACGNCGATDLVIVWQECDERDRPTTTRVALCKRCSDEIVESHPRLYDAVPRNVPLPGAMATCDGCRFSVDLACRNPLLTLNGGPGLQVRYSEPSVQFIDGRDSKTGRRWGRRVSVYADPPICEGREPKGASV